MISVANRDYLLSRDLCIMSLAFAVIYIGVCIASYLVCSCGVVIFILIEFIATMIATRSKGKRLAYNVIAADVTEEK